MEYLFIFINIGEFDFVIVDVKGSCGCIVLEYLKILVVLGV